MTDADVIEKFGGPSAVANFLGLDRRVVSNWKSRGIPKPWRRLMRIEAAEKQIKLPKSF